MRYYEQGDLGDCWLIAAFGIFADYPEYINKMILAEYETGVYVVQICFNGVWQQLTLDNQFRIGFNKKENQWELKYAKCKDQLWVNKFLK